MGFFAERRKRQITLILTALAQERETPHTGLTLKNATELAYSTVSVRLQQLIQDGLVVRTREEEPILPAGRPARFFYTLTTEGRTAAELAVAA